MGDLRYELLASMVKIVYVQFFVQFYIYDTGIPLAKAIKLFTLDLIWLFPACLGAFLFYQWVGHLFLDAKMKSVSHEGLLNNLKEGVFIVSPEDYSL